MAETPSAPPAALAPMPKGYEPREVEGRWLRAWEQGGVAVAEAGSSASPFSMVIPPPNITGSLHLGHALDMTLQDIVARWKRMSGRDVLWVPGTDHAGIAAQNVVEKQLAEEGLHRKEMGRESFERRMWAWKEEYGSRIVEQMRLLGLSCDWTRQRFTLDPGLSRAVRRVFVELYRAGLIYRGRYMVNWCPRCETAISDLEVRHRQVQGKMWRIRYRLLPEGSGGSPGVVEVDTTRPETMLGDTALAVHPSDRRYRKLVGRAAVLPVLGRRLPIVADGYVDPDFGTGVVKVTPAHDPRDYEAGQRHDLPLVQVIDRTGRMTAAAGPFAGLERFECRRRLLDRLRREGALAGERGHVHAVGHCDRCDAMVEPLPSTQWFVRMEPLARPALEAVEEGRIRFVPQRQVKVYREWMANLRDWCISRQLWWGHRIPAWSCQECGELAVAEEDPGRCPHCGGPLRQEEDVLDTWFSSALWPFSTMGWPDETPELRRYYPTDLLVTGYDILFFWVARMIMMGLRFRGEVPFRTVFFHGLVRDERGEKMSKSRGNVIDPLEMVDRYGADALRFTLASMAAPGADMALSLDRLAGYRAFCNKLWNAARFVLLNLGDEETALQASADAADPSPASLADRWILSRTARMIGSVERALRGFRFDEACHALYHFIWHEYCDWYIEMAKVALASDDAAAVRSARGTLMAVLETLLRALHPVMPFITEEVWSRFPGKRGLLAQAPWPAVQREWLDEEAEAQVELLRSLVTAARRLRAEVGLDPGRRVPLTLVAESGELRSGIDLLRPYLAVLARGGPVELVAGDPGTGPAVREVVGEVEVVLRWSGDLAAGRQRLQRSLRRVEEELRHLTARLRNRGFLEKAPAGVVAEAEARRAELVAEQERLSRHLRALGG